MKRYINATLVLSLSLVFIAVFIGIGSVHAAASHALQVVASDSRSDACNGLNQLGGTSCGGGQAGINKVITAAVTIISYIAGVIAIIMIVISGVRYMASGGDSTKVGAAKTALIYALIGVAVVALAQVLVHFVLNEASGV